MRRNDSEQHLESSFRFYENRACEFYPCHEKGSERFNCLFCYCPMYYAICLGEPRYIQANGSAVKDCSGCTYPHKAENYQTIVEYLTLILKV